MSGEGIVNTALLPVYAEREILQIRTDELLYGTSIKITDTKERDRYRIETDYQYTGLVSSQGIMCEKRNIAAWKRGPFLMVEQRFCDVLAQPTVKSKVLLTLYRGALLVDLGMATNPGWRCVRMVDGTDAYVRQEQVKTYLMPMGEKNKECESYADSDMCNNKEAVNENELREALVNTAYSYLGTPYRWGGKSTIGIDCSGFTFMVYALNGIYIHRDSTWIPQSPIRKVADCEKKPGDLLYFSGHIAMYLGNGEYIHSTAKDGAGVTINSLNRSCVGYRADLAQAFLYAGTVF